MNERCNERVSRQRENGEERASRRARAREHAGESQTRVRNGTRVGTRHVFDMCDCVDRIIYPSIRVCAHGSIRARLAELEERMSFLNGLEKSLTGEHREHVHACI